MGKTFRVVENGETKTVYVNEEEIFTGDTDSEEFREIFASKMGWVYVKRAS